MQKGFVLAELEKRDASDTVEKTRLDYDQAARQLETAQDTFEASRIAYEQAQLNLGGMSCQKATHLISAVKWRTQKKPFLVQVVILVWSR
ncbi:MAG: multidrug resistance efflux pump [Candidatus Azotimanducaceae bacterium]